MKKNVLVTGSTGFIGQALLNTIDTQLFKVIIYKRGDDLACLDRVDYAIHLAGKAHDKGAVWDDFKRDNIDLTKNIIDALEKNNKQAKFIYFSSAKVYGEYSDFPLVESQQLLPYSDYGRSKLLAEKIVSSSQLQYIIFRPPLVYSSNAKGNLDVLRKVARLGFPLPSNINNKRSLATIEFVVLQIVNSLNEKIPWNDSYNLANLTLSTTDIFKLTGVTRFLKYPEFILSLLPKSFKEKLIMNLELDNSKLLAALADD